MGINMPAARTVYNDVNYLVTSLIRSFRDYDTYEYLLYVRRMIKKFGLEKANADAYIPVSYTHLAVLHLQWPH